MTATRPFDHAQAGPLPLRPRRTLRAPLAPPVRPPAAAAGWPQTARRVQRSLPPAGRLRRASVAGASVPHLVADVADGMEVSRLVGIVPDFATHLRNMEVKRLGWATPVRVPHLVDEVLAANHLGTSPHEELEQVELSRRQGDHVPI